MTLINTNTISIGSTAARAGNWPQGSVNGGRGGTGMYNKHETLSIKFKLKEDENTFFKAMKYSFEELKEIGNSIGNGDLVSCVIKKGPTTNPYILDITLDFINDAFIIKAIETDFFNLPLIVYLLKDEKELLTLDVITSNVEYILDKRRQVHIILNCESKQK